MVIYMSGIFGDIEVFTGDMRQGLMFKNEGDMNYSEFCDMVIYVFENVDLEDNDPRIKLIEKINDSQIVDGRNKGRKILKIES